MSKIVCRIFIYFSVFGLLFSKFVFVLFLVYLLRPKKGTQFAFWLHWIFGQTKENEKKTRFPPWKHNDHGCCIEIVMKTNKRWKNSTEKFIKNINGHNDDDITAIEDTIKKITLPESQIHVIRFYLKMWGRRFVCSLSIVRDGLCDTVCALHFIAVEIDR